jgi:hypothetical protein
VVLPAHRPGAAELPAAEELREEELPGEEPRAAEHPEEEPDHLFPARDNREASLDVGPILSPGTTRTRMPDEETLPPILSIGTPIKIWERAIKRWPTC